MQTPLIIAAPGRSGTTMLAGLLHEHGVWIGEGRITPHKQTNSLIVSENAGIKQLLKRMARELNYCNHQLPLPAVDRVEERAEELLQYLRGVVPEGQPWLVKTTWTLVFGEVWKAAFPEARWLFVQRNIMDIVRSNQRHPVMRKRNVQSVYMFASALRRRQHYIAQTTPDEYSLFVDIDRVASCDMEECKRVLRFCGLTPDERIIKQWIKPEMWHGRKEKKIC